MKQWKIHWNGFILNKNCLIFGQPFGKELFDEEALKITVDEGIVISENISKINAYLKWLNSGNI